MVPTCRSFGVRLPFAFHSWKYARHVVGADRDRTHPRTKAAGVSDRTLTAGATVFDFSALAHTGQALKLSDFLHRPTVVYFCAQDKAAPCTALATALRDSWTDLNAQVDMVFGVSSEPSIVHDDFASEQHLPFLMLSDTDNTLHRVFGIQPGTVVSYLIGTDRKILQVFTPPNISAPAVEILNALTASGQKQPPYPM